MLPGLDGTGTLLAQFAETVRPHFASVTIIAYPRDQALGYAALERLAREALPRDEPFVLLGESFSGPVALAIAADPPPELQGVVLSTSFARCPWRTLRPFAPLATWLPVRAAPTPLLAWWLLGRWATPEWNARLEQSLASVSPDVLRSRVQSALRAAVAIDRVSVPVLYLRATQDRLMPSAASACIAAATPRTTVVDIQGPHLLLQAAPEASAHAIAMFIATV